MPPESADGSSETAEGVFVESLPVNDITTDSCQDANRQDFSGTCQSAVVDNAYMGKMATHDPEGGISRELRRFQLLVAVLRESGINQAEMARRTGIDSTHINKLCNPEKYGYTGLSTDIVRKVRDGLNISTDIFFDKELRAVSEQKDLLNVYSLSDEREKKWQRSVEERLHELGQFKHESTARILEMQAALERKEHEINRLKRELAQAQTTPKTRRPT